MKTTSKRFVSFFGIGCLVTAVGLSTSYGDDDPPPIAPAVDQRLLDGLDDLPPPRPNSSADIAGEDLGAAKPESTLAGLARLMRGVEQRIRQNDTSTATTQLQSDIAGELAKMLEAAEQQSASQSSAAAADQPRARRARPTPTGQKAIQVRKTELAPRNRPNCSTRFGGHCRSGCAARSKVRCKKSSCLATSESSTSTTSVLRKSSGGCGTDQCRL